MISCDDLLSVIVWGDLQGPLGHGTVCFQPMVAVQRTYVVLVEKENTSTSKEVAPSFANAVASGTGGFASLRWLDRMHPVTLHPGISLLPRKGPWRSPVTGGHHTIWYWYGSRYSPPSYSALAAGCPWRPGLPQSNYWLWCSSNLHSIWYYCSVVRTVLYVSCNQKLGQPCRRHRAPMFCGVAHFPGGSRESEPCHGTTQLPLVAVGSQLGHAWGRWLVCMWLFDQPIMSPLRQGCPEGPTLPQDGYRALMRDDDCRMAGDEIGG